MYSIPLFQLFYYVKYNEIWIFLAEKHRHFFLFPNAAENSRPLHVEHGPPATSNVASLPNFIPKNAVSRRVPNLRKMN